MTRYDGGPDMMVEHTTKKLIIITDFAIRYNSTVIIKETEKTEKYQDGTRERYRERGERSGE